MDKIESALSVLLKSKQKIETIYLDGGNKEIHELAISIVKSKESTTHNEFLRIMESAFNPMAYKIIPLNENEDLKEVSKKLSCLCGLHIFYTTDQDNPPGLYYLILHIRGLVPIQS